MDVDSASNATASDVDVDTESGNRSVISVPGSGFASTDTSGNATPSRNGSGTPAPHAQATVAHRQQPRIHVVPISGQGRDRSGTVVLTNTRRADQDLPQNISHLHTQRRRQMAELQRLIDMPPTQPIAQAYRARPVSRNRTVRGGTSGSAMHRLQSGNTPSTSTPASGSASASTSRPDTETEDDGDPDGDIDGYGDGDGDVEMSHEQDDTDENLPPPTRAPHHVRRTGSVGMAVDSPSPTAGPVAVGGSDSVDVDAHIIINTDPMDGVPMGHMGHIGGIGVGGVGVGADDGGLVAATLDLEQGVLNDDLAMGAPPGAPGAIEATPTLRGRTHHHGHHHGHTGRAGGGPMLPLRDEMTPRAPLAPLPMPLTMPSIPTTPTPFTRAEQAQLQAQTQARGRPLTATQIQSLDAAMEQVAEARRQASIRLQQRAWAGQQGNIAATAAPPHAATAPTAAPDTGRHQHRRHAHHVVEDVGPFREEDVLMSLQLLAYLSKYPHVRQAFYTQRVGFHPVTIAAALAQCQQPATASDRGPQQQQTAEAANGAKKESASATLFKSLTGRGVANKQSQQAQQASPSSNTSSSTTQQVPPRMTNVFSLVERFTFRPSPSESSLPNPPPSLPADVQHWAGVIMRNACRKDESRGGVRQCANSK